MSGTTVYVYAKKRQNFGRQDLFSETRPALIDSIDPNKGDQRGYGLRNPVSQEAQASLSKSENYVNTTRVEYKTTGMNHSEGGWPKEVHYDNEEETVRFRRRVEREDDYVHAIMKLSPQLEYYIKQNNAIQMYEQYFRNMEKTTNYEKPTANLNNVYRDADKRPVAGLVWTIEEDPKLVVSYCDKKYPVHGPVNTNYTGSIWDLENSNSPAFEFNPPCPCWNIACSPENPAIIIGGLDDGRVCVFDIRAGKEAIAFSATHTAHRNPVTAILYLQSRQSNEFFTGSSDGQCLWHDIRNLSEPIDSLIMSINTPPGEKNCLAYSEGVTSLQFERALPTRFLCGTDTGYVINVNRKGKTHNELMSGIFNAHLGPVRSIHRSPCTTKMFLTCGDWTVHIWSDDIKSRPIMAGMMHRYSITDAVWAKERVSGYMTVSVDGNFRYWDLLRKYHEPVVTLRVSKHPLLRILPHYEGRLVAMGDKLGTVFLVSVSRDLVTSGEQDKQLMLQNYERECRREHIITGRLKEIRLKALGNEDGTQTEEVIDVDALVAAAEEEYKKHVIEEFHRSGIPQTSVAHSFKNTTTMRKR